MNEEIVVSVLVLTYNSSEYIIETLESIKNQSYLKIELIVSDDKSSDSTIELIKKWLADNEDRFTSTNIIVPEVNTGITKNMNRGIKNCTGTFIKPIAGDDLLLENCVEDMTKHMINNSLGILYSRVKPFNEFGEREFELNSENEMYDLFYLDVKQQYRKLLKSFSIYTIGIQFSKKFIVDIGLFDEKYEMMEDYPLALKVTSLGYKINLIDKYTVKYRVRGLVSRSVFLKSKRNTAHYSNLRQFESEELLPRLKEEKMFVALYDTYVRRIAVKVENLNSSYFFLALGRLIRLFMVQNWYNRINRLKRRIVGNEKF